MGGGGRPSGEVGAGTLGMGGIHIPPLLANAISQARIKKKMHDGLLHRCFTVDVTCHPLPTNTHSHTHNTAGTLLTDVTAMSEQISGVRQRVALLQDSPIFALLSGA
jgi:hypothetical protein